MCGICGVYSKDGVDSNDTKKMVKILAHRGPDGHGIYTTKNISLGHTRLAIIDLSNKGKQPMISDNGEAVISYNGEVYNYLELRVELEKLGYKFHSDTDTEVVLNSYLAWGKQCIEKFNGMWAFAIWDERTNELWMSRDQFGIKPLYHTEVEGKIYFASEIKALLPFKKATPNKKRCYLFFTGREGENDIETMFEGVYKVPFSYTPQKKESPNPIQDFKKIFTDSVNLRLRADVPIGTCLSGGLDSSSIVCTLLQNESITSMKSFSACYDDKEADERDFISEVANDKLEKHYIFPTYNRLQKDMDKLVYHQEEPFDSTSIFAQWCVMEEAKKQGVKVMLDGQGADELLGGYVYYHKFKKPTPKDRVGIKVLEHPDLHKIYKQFKHREMQKHYSATPYPKMFKSKLTNRLYFDFTTTLPRLLKWEDRNSMAFGLEARPPFLDTRLADIGFSIPDSLKINNGWTKCILRKAMKGTLPEKIRLRRDKKGFFTPEAEWLNQMHDEIKYALEKPFAEEVVFKKGATKRYVDAFYNGDKSKMKMVWKLYCFEKWGEVFF